MPGWLMLTISILVVTVYGLLGFVSALTTAVGLPGAWMLVGGAAAIELLDPLWLPDGAAVTFGWGVIAAAALVALLGELFEFLAGALGAAKAGASRRGVIGATVGGLAGAILGVVIPPPIVGSLIGALVGTFAGAVAGELLQPETVRMRDTVRPATGAAIGRILGTLAKVPCAVAAWVILLVAAVIRLVG